MHQEELRHFLFDMWNEEPSEFDVRFCMGVADIDRDGKIGPREFHFIWEIANFYLENRMRVDDLLLRHGGDEKLIGKGKFFNFVGEISDVDESQSVREKIFRDLDFLKKHHLGKVAIIRFSKYPFFTRLKCIFCVSARLYNREIFKRFFMLLLKD